MKNIIKASIPGEVRLMANAAQPSSKGVTATTTIPEAVPATPEQSTVQELQKQLDEANQKLEEARAAMSSGGVPADMDKVYRECIRAGHTQEDARLIAKRAFLREQALKIKDAALRDEALLRAVGAM